MTHRRAKQHPRQEIEKLSVFNASKLPTVVMRVRETSGIPVGSDQTHNGAPKYLHAIYTTFTILYIHSSGMYVCQYGEWKKSLVCY